MSFKQGDIVWADRSPLPQWPARIISKKGKSSPQIYSVIFLGDSSLTIEIEEKKLSSYQENYQTYHPSKEILKKNKKLEVAMKEVDAAINSHGDIKRKKNKGNRNDDEVSSTSNAFLKQMKQEQLKILDKKKSKTFLHTEEQLLLYPTCKEQSKKFTKRPLQNIIKQFSKPEKPTPIQFIYKQIEKLYFEGPEVYKNPCYYPSVKQKLQKIINELSALKETDKNAKHCFDTMICSLIKFFIVNLDPNYFQNQIHSLQNQLTTFNNLILQHTNSTDWLNTPQSKDFENCGKDLESLINKGYQSMKIVKIRNEINGCIDNKFRLHKQKLGALYFLKKDIENILVRSQSQFQKKWQQIRQMIDNLDNVESIEDVKKLLEVQ